MSETIKVGPVDFKLLVAEQTELTETAFLGRLDMARETITINADLAPKSAKITVWHEVIHAILLQAGINNHSEGEIEALSYGIVSVLINNEILRMNE